MHWKASIRTTCIRPRSTDLRGLTRWASSLCGYWATKHPLSQAQRMLSMEAGPARWFFDTIMHLLHLQLKPTSFVCLPCLPTPSNETRSRTSSPKTLPKAVGKGRYNRKENRGISSFGRELTPFVTKRCPWSVEHTCLVPKAAELADGMLEIYGRKLGNGCPVLSCPPVFCCKPWRVPAPPGIVIAKRGGEV